MSDKIKNPDTGRLIDKNGPTHKKLIKEGKLDEDGNVPGAKATKKSVEKPATKKSVEKEIKAEVKEAVEDSAEDILRKAGIVSGTKKTVPEIKAFAETHKIVISKKLKAEIVEEIREKFIKSLASKATAEVKATLPKQPSKRDVKEAVEEAVDEVVEKAEKKEKKHKKEKKEKKEKKHKERKCYGKKKVKCGDEYICVADGKCVSKKDHLWEYEYTLLADDEIIYGSKKELEDLQKKLGGTLSKVEKPSAFETAKVSSKKSSTKKSSTKKSSTKKSTQAEPSFDRSKYTPAELKVVDVFEECIKGL